MFKLVVLFAFFAAVFAKPAPLGLIAAPLTYAAGTPIAASAPALTYSNAYAYNALPAYSTYGTGYPYAYTGLGYSAPIAKYYY